MSGLVLPRRRRGRQSAAAQERYDQDVEEFAGLIMQIRSRLDFDVSSRGWCYILEEHGLAKGDFDAAQNVINECRKRAILPLNIAAEDGSRQFENIEKIDDADIGDEAESIIEYVEQGHLFYTPISFWDDQPVYVQMLVEKIDLKSLFRKVCSQYRVPIANAKGWADINMRAAMMRRFADMEAQGKQCVLLYCGDHDPMGLNISEFLRTNLADLSDAVEWFPDDLIIDRFGLNHDFIEREGLSWIDNLETGSGRRLDDPRHPDHAKPYVQDYLRRFGARKVEANTLVTRPDAGRELCRQAIHRYIDPDAPNLYERKLATIRDELKVEVGRLMEARL